MCIIQEFVVHCSIRLLNKVSEYIFNEEFEKKKKKLLMLSIVPLLFIVGYISKRRKKKKGGRRCVSVLIGCINRELPMPLYHDGREKKIPKASADGYRSPNPLSLLSAAPLSQCALLVIYSS